MKFVVKVIVAPFIALLTIFIHISALLLSMSAMFFGIAATLLCILAVLTMLSVSVKNGLIILVVAFMVSPLGLPMLVARLLGQLQRLRFVIQGQVYG